MDGLDILGVELEGGGGGDGGDFVADALEVKVPVGFVESEGEDGGGEGEEGEGGDGPGAEDEFAEGGEEAGF